MFLSELTAVEVHRKVPGLSGTGDLLGGGGGGGTHGEESKEGKQSSAKTV